MMENVTLKIPEALKEKLKFYSEKLGVSKSDIIREAITEYLEKDTIKEKESFLDLAGDLAGSIEGEQDLSSNKEYLNGYGE